VHAFVPGCPVCIAKLLLRIRCFSDKLNDDDDDDDDFLRVKVKVAHTRLPSVWGSRADPGSWQSACR